MKGAHFKKIILYINRHGARKGKSKSKRGKKGGAQMSYGSKKLKLTDIILWEILNHLWKDQKIIKNDNEIFTVPSHLLF